MTSIQFVVLLFLVGTSYVVSQRHVAEVYFVVEPKVIQNYMDVGYSKSDAIKTIKGDLELFVYEANRMYRSMEYFNVYIELRIKELKIMDRAGDVMFEDCILIRHKELQADMSLNVFKVWLEDTKAAEKVGYDVAIILTGYDVFGSSGNNQVTGYATYKAACNPKLSVGIVEFDGTMNTAGTIAHEVGHSLGAEHDQGKCDPRDGYIMTPTAKVDNKHKWEFSSCSIQGVFNYIASLNKKHNNCLLKTTTPRSNFKISDEANRDVLKPDKICQRSQHFKGSFFCNSAGMYRTSLVKGDAVCQKLFCKGKSGRSCFTSVPTDGMVCDVNKRCDKERCVHASFPTPIGLDRDCLYGDDKSAAYIHKGKSLKCPEFVAEEGYTYCYQDRFRRTCCNTCKKARTNIGGCEYGDRIPNCSEYQAENICRSASNFRLCCKFCRDHHMAAMGKRDLSNGTLAEVDMTSGPTSPIEEEMEIEVENVTEDDVVSMA